MEQLWAPWRMPYILQAQAAGPDDPCFICRGLREQDDRRNLIVLAHAPQRGGAQPLSVQQRPSAGRAPRHKGRLDELDERGIARHPLTLRRMVGDAGRADAAGRL